MEVSWSLLNGLEQIIWMDSWVTFSFLLMWFLKQCSARQWTSRDSNWRQIVFCTGVSFLEGVATAPQPYSVHIPGRLDLVESNLIFAQWYLGSWQSASWQWESSRTNPKKQLGSDRALKCHLCAHLKKDSHRGPFNGGGHQHYPQLQPVIPEVSLKTPCKTDSWTEKMANQMLGGNIW